MRVALRSSSPEDTLAIARALGAVLRPGDVVALTGDLGAGKTLFCRGVGEALGIPPGRIVSPSFTIVAEHEGRLPLRHVDAYRLASPREAEEAGIDELLGGEAVCLVEWAEKIAPLLPKGCIQVKFHFSTPEGEGRLITLEAGDEPRFAAFLVRVGPLTTGG